MTYAQGPGRSQLLLLALLSALASIATHSFVPAMPAAAIDLVVDTHEIQLAVSCFLVALAIGQAIAGPLSDEHGRRPVLIGGAVLFALGSGVSAAAPGLPVLLLGRVLQGVGGACGLVVARSVIVDTTPQQTAPAKLALLMLIALASPALAPILGGVITQLVGWRAIFVLLCLLGLLAAIGVAVSLPESRSRTNGCKGSAIQNYISLAFDAHFIRYALTGACGSAGIYAFLTGSSFVFLSFHLSTIMSSLAYAVVALSVAIGAISLSRDWWRGRAIVVGAASYLAGGVSMALTALTIGGPVALVGSMMLVGFGSGLVSPSALSRALTARSGRAGTASSLFGALQIAGGAIASASLSLTAIPTIVSIAVPICLAGFLINLLVLSDLKIPCAAGEN